MGVLQKPPMALNCSNWQKDVLNKFRIATARALGRGRSGASPWLSLSLVDRMVDFEMSELERKFFFWRRYTRIFPTRVHHIFSKIRGTKPTKGPVGAFRKTVSKFFTWEPNGNIYSDLLGSIDWINCSKRLLKVCYSTPLESVLLPATCT